MSKPATQIDLEIVDRIAFVTLNGPPKNEMDFAFFEALGAFRLRLFALDVRGVVLRGAGRHFSSGADVSEIQALAASNPELAASRLTDNALSYLALGALPFPVVAVVSGVCLGAALELALACTHRVAERNAVFALPEATYGIMPGCGGTVRLPRLIAPSVAVEMILSGRSVLADEALALGLVDQVVDRRRGSDAAIEMILDETP